jgi:hypothetical protein
MKTRITNKTCYTVCCTNNEKQDSYFKLVHTFLQFVKEINCEPAGLIILNTTYMHHAVGFLAATVCEAFIKILSSSIA